MLPLNPGSLTRRSNYERGPRAAHEMADGPGPIGFIFHRSSLKPVNFDGDSSTPANNTKLVVHSDKSSPERLAVRFVPVEGFGHFGYIEHVPSGKIVQPRGGSLDPWNNTKLVYRSDRHAGALFAFDEENERIMHRGGKIWQPRGGSPNPGDDTRCVLHSDVHDAAKFLLLWQIGWHSNFPISNSKAMWDLENDQSRHQSSSFSRIPTKI